MSKMKRTRTLLLLVLPLLTSGCSLDSAGLRIGVLVLVPFLLLIGVLWMLNRHPAEEEDWGKEHFPDSDDDDEDHYLM